MDKKTAALTLAEKLREDNIYHIIINPYYQKKLLKESLACYQTGDIIAFGPYAIRDSLKNKNSALYDKLEPKANYLFIESFEMDKRAIASSFAIIGKEEVNQLRNIFYKDVPDDVEIAMKYFNIRNHAELYKNYFNGSLDELLTKYSVYFKFQNILHSLFYNQPRCPANLFENYFDMTIKDLNKKLKDLEIPASVSDYDYSIHKDVVTWVVSVFEQSTMIGQFKDLLPDFFNLVFTIPYEDQNIEANKTVLKLPFETLDYVKILTGEYFKGKNFQDYFECLDAEKQKKVINVLEFKKADNSVYNSFLWSKGFRTIGLDHLRLYKDDTKGFIEYFNAKSAEERKVIIRDLMKSDITNEEVVNWLTKNYIDLVREVGLND